MSRSARDAHRDATIQSSTRRPACHPEPGPERSAIFPSRAATWFSPPQDVGQLTRTPIADHLGRMTDAVSISRSWPTVDTGDGNPLSVRRPVQVYEAAGAQAIVLEDEEWPQKCGPVSGRAPGDPDVPPPATKLEAALAARCDSRTVGIARTKAPGCLGLEEVLGHAEGLGPHGRRRQLPGGPPGRSRVPGRSPGPSRRPPSGQHGHAGQVAALHRPQAGRPGVQDRPVAGESPVGCGAGGRGRADRGPPGRHHGPPSATGSCRSSASGPWRGSTTTRRSSVAPPRSGPPTPRRASSRSGDRGRSSRSRLGGRGAPP